MDSLQFTALLLTKIITDRMEKLKLENQLLKLFYPNKIGGWPG